MFFITVYFVLLFFIKKSIKKQKPIKKIFIYWEQGWNEAPTICKYCLQSWKLYNADWKIIELDKNNLFEYLDISYEKQFQNIQPVQMRSDILRINLLKKYGGVWVDATTFCTIPLNSWILKQKTFFALSSPGKDRMISNWFMTNVYKKSYITNRLCDDVNSYWETMIYKNQYKSNQYFQFHYIFNKLYKKDYKFRSEWDNVNKIEASQGHYIIENSNQFKNVPPHVKKHIDLFKSPLYKIKHYNSHRVENLTSNNNYTYLVKKHLVVPKIKGLIHNKYLIVGSAPYIKVWVEKHLQWFVDNEYKIIPFNNAWSAIPMENIYEWHKPNDSNKHGTLIPSKEIHEKMKIITHIQNLHNFKHLVHNKHKNSSTMLFNVLYYLLTNNIDQFTATIIGCDMIYKKNGDTFYSHLPISKASNDPINKFTDKELSNELKNIERLYKKHSCIINNASESKETRLPYDRFSAYKDSF